MSVIGGEKILALKLLIQAVVILISLYVIRILRIPVGTISGNGNPVLAVIYPLIFLVFWGWTYFNWLRSFKLSKLLMALILTISLVVAVAGTISALQSFSKFKIEYKENYDKKYGGSIDSTYLEQISNGINIHTNFLYFNYTTFLIFVSILNIISVGSSFLTKPKQIDQCLTEQDKGQ